MKNLPTVPNTYTTLKSAIETQFAGISKQKKCMKQDENPMVA